jgi:hypothetical protein
MLTGDSGCNRPASLLLDTGTLALLSSFDSITRDPPRRTSITVSNQSTSKSKGNMSSKISAVFTKNAPPPRTVYSQAIIANGFVYCSGIQSLIHPWPFLTIGQLPADASGKTIVGDIKAHTVHPPPPPLGRHFYILTPVETMPRKFKCRSRGGGIES